MDSRIKIQAALDFIDQELQVSILVLMDSRIKM